MSHKSLSGEFHPLEIDSAHSFHDKGTDLGTSTSAGTSQFWIPLVQQPQREFSSSPSPASPLPRNPTRFALTWAVAFLALATSATTVFFASRVMVDKDALPPGLQLSPSAAVLVVNVLSHAVAFLFLTLCSGIMDSLRWALACRPNGVSLPSFFAMSQSTPLMGALWLCKARGWHRVWALKRYVYVLRPSHQRPLAYPATAFISASMNAVLIA